MSKISELVADIRSKGREVPRVVEELVLALERLIAPPAPVVEPTPVEPPAQQ